MAEEPSRDDRHGDAPEQTSRDPWRVEGSRQTGQQQPGGKAGATATWITVLVILGLYVVAIFVLSPHSGPTRLDIPYSVFREQVQRETSRRSRPPARPSRAGCERRSLPAGRRDRELAVLQDRTPGVRQRPDLPGAAGRRGNDRGQADLEIDVPVGVAAARVRADPADRRLVRDVHARRHARTGRRPVDVWQGAGAALRARRSAHDLRGVAGIDEATEDLEEVVDFLRNPDRYRSLGAMVPRGVVLCRCSGTAQHVRVSWDRPLCVRRKVHCQYGQAFGCFRERARARRVAMSFSEGQGAATMPPDAPAPRAPGRGAPGWDPVRHRRHR